MTEKYAGAARPAAPPEKPLPPLACDCHLHVFGDPARYPDRNPHPVHPTREASWEDALRMHRSLGFGRGVLVQPANYTSDHRYLEEALARLPRGCYRATGIIDEAVTDTQIERLHAAGMRGVRFNFVRMFRLAPSAQQLRRSIERIRPYGWHIKVFIGPQELAEHGAALRSITSIPVVIDHMARLKGGTRDQSRALVLELLRRENFWVLLSNGARMSAQASGWDDVVPIGQELYAAAPERSLFGTDWPHTHSHHAGGGPPESELIGLFERFLPGAAARQAVLVDNPARLYGFA